MNQDTSLEVLRCYRPLLLACEAIGWLHMTGKANIQFLQKHGGDSQIQYDDLKWYEDLCQISGEEEEKEKEKEWDKKLNWVKEKFAHSCKWPDSLTKFLSQHRGSNAGLLGLLQAGHAMASGIEKNLPGRNFNYLKQSKANMWLTTAFGHPVRNLLADSPPFILSKTGWNYILKRIVQLLKELEELGTREPGNIAQWWEWREKAVGPRGWLRKAFDMTLAETRLPNNEVTLFDQSYVAAALFKSAVAGALLEGESFPWDCGELKERTRWRLLTVGLGMDHFEARAVKIGDWTGIRQAAAEFFTLVRQLVEVEIPVGALLYQDSSLCIFSFPGERNDCYEKKRSEETLATIEKCINSWQKFLQDKIDQYAHEVKLELPPYVKISDQPSRSLAKMWQEIKSAREALSIPHHRFWQIPCSAIASENAKGHVCPVCQVRLNNVVTKKALPCAVCKSRRTHRLEDWLSDKTGLDTIWISEVADHNDRLALITMSLDIEPWLEGSRLDSLRTQVIQKAGEEQPNLIDNIRKTIEQNDINELGYIHLAKYISEKLKKYLNPNDPVFQSLCYGFNWEQDWPTFFNKIVEDRAEAPKWEELKDNDERAAWLTHQLLCKLSSPGRLYRFWRQSEAFFQELLKQFRGIVARDPNRWRVKRLHLIPENIMGAQPEETQPYNGRLPAGPISVLYQKEKGEFLTICNLARLLKPEQQAEDLPETITVKEDDSEETLTFTVKKQDKKEKEIAGVYYPLIPLELSPVRFRVLVPLAAANECVNAAFSAWREQFARVWDRLPLRIGVIAFSRLTPFQAVIEAARNIEAALAAQEDAEEWVVDKCEVENGVAKLQLQKAGNAHTAIHFDMPIQLPDGREDVFYPYLQVNDEQTHCPHDFKTPDGKIYRHVKDLQKDRVVYVYPAQIATVYLSSTALRFEPVTVRSLTEWEKMQEIWEKYLVKQAPSETAVHGAWEEIRQRWEQWHGPEGEWLPEGQEAWLKFVRATLAQLLKPQDKSEEIDWDFLTSAAQEGLLDWSLEWHLRVLKLSLSGGEHS